MYMDLLEHRDFVARIARRLIDDEHEVEDVVQEATLAALQGGPKPKAWWARVARNLSIDRLRRRSARRRREVRAARPEGTASTGELAERVAWQQRVVAAVLELEDHYKDVVLLRFYEELPPRDIAARLDIPVNTVNTRLRRAFGQLRARLEREAGGTDKLFSVLTPLAAYGTGRAATATTTTSVFGMKTVLVVLAVAVTLVGSMAFLGGSPRGESATPGVAGRGAAAAGITERAGEAIPEHLAGTVTAHLVGHLPRECADQGGVRVIVRSKRRVVHTEIAALGRMKLRYRHEAGDLTLEIGGPFVLKRTFPLKARATDLGEIRVERSFVFGGRVLDKDGAPLAGAVVYWNRGVAQSEPTDAKGRYRIEAPAVYSVSKRPDGYLYGCTLHVERNGLWSPGYLAHPRGFRLQHDFRAELEIGPVLQFKGAPNAVLALHPRYPMVSATRQAPLGRRSTDAKGIVAPHWPPWHGNVVASLRMENGEQLETILNRQEVCASEPYDIDLEETASIRLKVVDGKGQPLVGARVRLIGDWAPDGLREYDDGRFQAEDGAYEVRLHATVGADGVCAWRFPAEKPRDGIYMPNTWTCELDGTLLHGDFHVPTPKEVGVSGGFLPTLVVDAAAGERDGTLVIAGGVSCVSATFLRKDKTVAFDDWPGMQNVVSLADGKQQTHVKPDATYRPKKPLAFDRLVLVLQTRYGNATIELTHAEWRAAVRGKPIDYDEPTPRAARLRVLDPDGEPAANVLVVATSDRAVTDGDGWVSLNVPREGSVDVQVVNPVTGDGARLDEWSTGEPTLRLEKPRRVRFRVLLSNGKPHVGTVTFLNPGGVINSRSIGVGRDGWVHTPPLVPSLGEIHAAAFLYEGGKRVWVRLRVPLSDVKPEQTLTLERPASGGVRAK